MKTGFRIYIVIGLVVVMLILFQMIRIGMLLNTSQSAHVVAQPFDLGQASHLTEDERNLYHQNKGLIVYHANPEILENIEQTLKTLKISYDVMPASDHKPDYQAYDLIILLGMDRDALADHDQILQYAKLGGKLLYLGNGDSGISDILQIDAAFFGIRQTGPIRETNAVYFNTELLTGITGPVEISGEFMTPYHYFQSIDVNLDSDCTVHLESGAGNPLIWEKNLVNGKVMVMNVGRTESKEIRGLLAGSIAVFSDFFMNPIIGSEVVFIDDFPADYRSSPEILRENYGRDLQRFILEIWWPQMLGLMHQYKLKYTCAYIESYDNLVNGPFDFNMATQMTSARLVSDLLSHDGEVCLHGYNHQPLFFNQARMDRYDYKAWPGSTAIIEALQQSVQFFNLMFPQYQFYTYVPPSNLLDPAALVALKRAVPSLRVISGVYYGDISAANEDNPDDFDQNFGLDERYGVALPRVSSGGFLTDEVRYMIASVVTTNGIVNHFIHPDDILDSSRSRGLKWEDLYDEYDRMFGNFNKKYSWLSKDTASEAAAKLEQVENAVVYYSQAKQKITIACDHFENSLSLMVTTDQHLTAETNCTVQKIDSIRYLVTMQANKVTLEIGRP